MNVSLPKCLHANAWKERTWQKKECNADIVSFVCERTKRMPSSTTTRSGTSVYWIENEWKKEWFSTWMTSSIQLIAMKKYWTSIWVTVEWGPFLITRFFRDTDHQYIDERWLQSNARKKLFSMVLFIFELQTVAPLIFFERLHPKQKLHSPNRCRHSVSSFEGSP